jgi:hypothetical protein
MPEMMVEGAALPVVGVSSGTGVVPSGGAQGPAEAQGVRPKFLLPLLLRRRRGQD